MKKVKLDCPECEVIDDPNPTLTTLKQNMYFCEYCEKVWYIEEMTRSREE